MKTRQKQPLAPAPADTMPPSTWGGDGARAAAYVATPYAAPVRPSQADEAGSIGWFPAALRSHRGQERADNQDAVFGLSTLLPRLVPDSTPMPFGFYAVADGVGGLADGAAASTGAVRSVAAELLTAFLAPVMDGKGSAADQGTVVDILNRAVGAANSAIYRAARRAGAPSGTTFSAALLLGRRLTVAHVGDSRIYLFGPDGLRLLTTDHSMVNRLVEMGQMQPDEVYHNPQRNALYRTLGQAASVEVECVTVACGTATHLILCSDGLWDVIGEGTLRAILNSGDPLDIVADRLVMAANAQGGPDNISVILVGLEACGGWRE